MIVVPVVVPALLAVAYLALIAASLPWNGGEFISLGAWGHYSGTGGCCSC
jgi:hypothetical protein